MSEAFVTWFEVVSCWKALIDVEQEIVATDDDLVRFTR